MRALHILHQYWPHRHGSGAYFEAISERLARDGHPVTMLTSDAHDFQYFMSSRYRRLEKKEEFHNGVRIRRVRVRRLPHTLRTLTILNYMLPGDAAKCVTHHFPWVPGLFWSSLRERGYDIVHAGVLPHGNFIYAGYRIARRLGIPFVVTPFLHIAEGPEDPLRKGHSPPCLIRFVRAADRVIVQTDSEKEALAGLGVPRKKMRILGVGINPADVKGGSAERFLEKHGIDEPVVLFVGPRSYHKGTIHLVEACKLLWRRGFRFKLVLVGDVVADFRDYWSGENPWVKENTLVTGKVCDEEKHDAFAAATVFAMPSKADSFGIVYLESWFYGKPVIGARAGGVPDVIRDGVDGFLVPFMNIYMIAEYIGKLLSDGHLAGRMGKRGREKVLSRYTWSEIYLRLKGIYEELIGAK